MSPENFDPSKSLAEATVQELQLELIRRTRFNAFDGEQILESLLRHRHLWEAVILDQLGLSRVPGKLPPMGLIKLRDLGTTAGTPTNSTSSRPEAAAGQLAVIAESEDWGGEPLKFHGPKNQCRSRNGRTKQWFLPFGGINNSEHTPAWR
jgi:hypothetical protein